MIIEFTLIANNQNNELVIAHTHAFLIIAAGAPQLFIIHHSLFIMATPPFRYPSLNCNVIKGGTARGGTPPLSA